MYDPRFVPVAPWAPAPLAECFFYHTMSYPDGEVVPSAWDIGSHFDSYIGHYPISGKTLLDVGTASGFLTFRAEQAGAAVTSLDVLTAREITHIPFEQHLFHVDRAAFIESHDRYFRGLRNSYWYGWHKFGSRAEMVYAPLADLPFWDRRFEVVLAGAIVEHLSDPVTMIGNMSRLATEAVLVAFTPVLDTDDLIMEAGANWRRFSPDNTYTWWTLSRGLYRQLFDNLGFDVEFVDAYAVATFAGLTEPSKRTTIVARRRGRA